MYARKVLTTMLLFTMFLSLFAAFVGEPFEDEANSLNETDNISIAMGGIEDSRGTRAQSSNIDMASKMLFGPATDVHVVGNYAYVTAGCSLLIFDVTDTFNPTLVGFYDAEASVNGVFVEGNYAYLANSYKGLNIVNVSTPSSPTNVKTIFTFGATIDVYVTGAHAYIAQGYIISGYRGISVVDISDIPNADVVGSYESDGTPYCLMVSGNYAYVASENEGFLTLDVSDPRNPTFEGLNETYADPMTPYTRDVFVSGSYAFVVDYYSDFYVFDITDPADPQAIEYVETPGSPMELTIDGDYAYIADGSGGLSIIEISDPTNPGSAINHPLPDSAWSIFVVGTNAYIAGWSYGLRIIDVSGTPPAPSDEGYWITGYYAYDVHVVGDYAYIADEEGGLKILDITDPFEPTLLGFYETGGYSTAVYVEGDFAYLAEGWGGITVVDVINPTAPSPAWSFNTPGNAEGIFVLGSYAYVADYDEGLRIININTQQEVGDVPAHQYAYSVHVIDGFAYVGDSRGLMIANVTDPNNPTEEGFYGFSTSGYVDIYVVGSYAYLAESSDGLTIIDITDPTNPTLSTTYDLSLSRGVFASGSTVYLTNSDMLVAVDSSTLTEIGYFDPGCNPVKVDIVGQYAYVAATQGGAYILDISQVADLTPPQIETTFPENDAIDVAIKTDINVSFNENMNHDSAENAFSISPTVNGEYSWNDTTLIFTPDVELIPETEYTVTLVATVIDTADNTLDGNGNGVEEGSPTDDYSWQFTTRALPPVVESVFPENGSSSIEINTSLNITFSKTMDRVSTQSAFSYTDGESTWTISAGDVSWSNGDRTMTFTPYNILAYEKMFNITVESTAQDTDGESLDGDNDGVGGEVGEDDYTWSFTTVPAPPQIISTFPEDGMQDVFVDSNLIINFSKSMNTGSVEGAFSYTDGVTTWYAGSGVVTWNNYNTTFTFTPGSDLQNGVKFWVNLSYSAMDTDGILLDGDGDGTPGEVEEDNYTWEFTTIPSPPKIDSTIPQNGATFVLVDVSVIINFSHSMDKSSTQAAFSYTDGNLTFDSSYGLVSWSNNDRTMTFKPFSYLENEKTYTFTIEHTAVDVNLTALDGDNDGIGGEGTEDDYTWSFSTIFTPPKIISTFPEAGDQDVKVNTNIIILFSKPMDRVSVQNAFNYTDGITEWGISDGIVTWRDNDRNFTFTPSSAFDNNLQYLVTIAHTAKDVENVFLDVDGDPTPGEPGEDDYTWSFTTIPLPPQIITTSPPLGSTLVLINSSVTIEFSKSMDTSSTQAALTYTYNGIKLDSSNGFFTWSNEDRTMTFTPQVLFQNEMVYIFKIEHTATDIDDILFDGDYDGNGGEEIEDDYIWSFTTMHEPPRVMSTTPKRNDIDVAVDTVIEVIFSNPMDETSVEDAFTFTHEDANLTWDVFDGNVTWDDDSKIMTFKPSFLLEYNMIYTLKIEATAKDNKGVTLDGNRNKLPEGVDRDNYISYFTTIPEPPRVESVEPSDGQTDVAIDADIVITFDKSMNKGATEKAFSYTYQGSTEDYDKSDGSIEWTNNDKTLTFNPDLDFEEGEKYTFTIDDSAKDEDGIAFEGYEWSFTIKVNSAPVLAGGGVNPEKGDTSKMFKFSIVYTDEDNDRPESIEVVIGDISNRMLESDPKDEDYTDGKHYEFEISLDEGDHKYYFEASDEKHDVRFPAGQAKKTVKVSAVEEELIFGFLEEEYLGMPTLICGPIGIIFIIAIIISLILIMRGGRPEEEPMAFEAFEGAPQFTFMPTGEEEIMSFTAFEETPSLEEVRPVLIQCPECERHLRVRAVTRPFMFPCSCGAKLILK